MKKKKKYPEIKPKYLKDKNKVIGVYLDMDIYESIFEEMKDLKKEIAILRTKSKKND